MAILIPASTILTSLCLFHITLAYFFYTDPQTIADQALVFFLGEATGMPHTQHFSKPSPSSALLAVVLLLLGISDLITLSMPEEIWLVHYWCAQAPARIVVFGLLTLFSYLTTPSSHAPARSYGTGSGADGLRNRVFFAFAFLECLSWVWAWFTLREEAAEFAKRKRRRASTAAREQS
ncbi:increased loss of mitochondrial DNA protein 1 [Xylariaceae sp. FL1019]|nr:increased loss of mitochondrial DNA protein 1 [Xylariaceae sp. FL1019]